MATTRRMEQLETDIAGRPGGEEWVFIQLAAGSSVQEIARDLDISRRFLYEWRDLEEHRERRREWWAAAIRMRAEADLKNVLVRVVRLDRVIDTELPGRQDVERPQPSRRITGPSMFRQWLAAWREARPRQ